MGMLIKKGVKISHQSLTPDNNIDVSGFTDWTDTGLALTLPGVGTYSVYFNVTMAYAQGATFDNHWVEARVYNQTASAVVAGTGNYLMALENLAPNGDYFIRTCNINFVITVTEETVLSLQAVVHSVNAAANIDKDHTGYGYLMLG